MQLNQGPNQVTNAVILYRTGSEQLRKCYDNFGVRRATYLTKTDRYWTCFLTTSCAIYFGSRTLERTWLLTLATMQSSVTVVYIGHTNSLHKAKKYPVPFAKSTRFKNSFIPHALANFW